MRVFLGGFFNANPDWLPSSKKTKTKSFTHCINIIRTLYVQILHHTKAHQHKYSYDTKVLPQNPYPIFKTVFQICNYLASGTKIILG
jgi:hypothetical protein